MYIGEGVPYVHAVFLPPPRHRFGALLGTPPLQKWAKKVIFGGQNSVVDQNSKELFELLKYFFRFQPI